MSESVTVPFSTETIRRVPTVHTKRTVAPWDLPISLETMKDHLNMTSSIKDTDITQKIHVATYALETALEIALMEQTWIEAWDKVDSVIDLQIRPNLSVTSIKYIASFDADTEAVIDPATYVVDDDSICARTTWPTHRGWRSIRITHTAGYKAKGTGDAAALAAARAAIPYELSHAVAMLAAYLYENREGQGFEAQFVSNAARGMLPPMVTQFITPYIKWGV